MSENPWQIDKTLRLVSERKHHQLKCYIVFSKTYQMLARENMQKGNIQEMK